MRKRKKVFWGVLFLLAAVALVVRELGYLQEMGFWSILFSICLCGICVSGMIKQKWGQILFSIAFFIIVNDKLLNLESLTPWTVLGVALLGTIGLNILFPGNKKHFLKHGSIAGSSLSEGEWNEDERISTEKGDIVRFDVSFGSSVKYVNSRELSEVVIDSSFGDISVYLTEAVLKDHRGKVSVDVSFGNADIYVPASWAVVTNISASFGNADTSGNCDPNGEEKLLIQGDVSFGEFMIHYV